MSQVQQIVAAAIVDNLSNPSRLLIARRSAPSQYAGLFEFPGGKVEPGESPEAAVHREIREELGVSIELGAELVGPETYGWPLSEKSQMRLWCASIVAGEPAPLEAHEEIRWVPLVAEQLFAAEWIPADLPILRALCEQWKISVEA